MDVPIAPSAALCDCPVCFEPLAVQHSSGRAGTRLVCGHAFHRDCLSAWMRRADEASRAECHWKCPVCREFIVPAEEGGGSPADARRRLCLDFAGGGHAGIRLTGEAADAVVVVGLHGPDLARRAGLCLGARVLSVNDVACRHHAHAVGMIEAVRLRGRRCVLAVQLPRPSWLTRVAAFAGRCRRARAAG